MKMSHLPFHFRNLFSRKMPSKLQNWLKGKRLHWSLYLAISCTVLGGLLQINHYLSCHLYSLQMDGVEIGLVRDPEEIEQFIEDLTCKCSDYYELPLFTEQDIAFIQEYRPGEEADLQSARDALMQNIRFLTDAIMVTVDGTPVAPVSAPEEVDKVVDGLCHVYENTRGNVELLDVELEEEIAGEKCTVAPEQVFSAGDITALLSGQKEDSTMLLASREMMLSRFGRNGVDGGRKLTLPAVHVRSVEKVTVEEKISFATEYINSSKMYMGESKVSKAGKEGLQRAVYRVTRENGAELSREALSREIIREPVNRVVERGTLRRFTWPVASGGRISQRFHGGHRGIDIAAPLNSTVVAAESGVVVISGWGAAQGNYIVIDHGAYYTVYLHNNANLVSAGQRVSRGQTIARLGSTGNSTGPHLHFEIRRSIGSSWGGWYRHPAINPLQFF